MQTRSDKSGNMGDIGHNDRADFISDLTELSKIQCPRISAGTDNIILGLCSLANFSTSSKLIVSVSLLTP